MKQALWGVFVFSFAHLLFFFNFIFSVNTWLGLGIKNLCSGLGTKRLNLACVYLRTPVCLRGVGDC